jgi:uncharacterized protein (TIGR02646 family)
MKRIVKSNSPVELAKWFAAQPTTDIGKLNCRYSNLPSDIRSIVKQRLLQDQGYICCYTGIRVNDARSHIEHLKPQSRYFDRHEDIDYDNLVAAYPGADATQCAYGAHPKADWYDETHFVSPLSPQCEAAFRFNLKGEIQAEPANIAAKTTIEWLKLEDAALTEMRQQAIQTLLFDAPLSIKQAEELLERMFDRNKKDQFRPFCFVLKQACEEYIKRQKQAQTRKKAIRSQDKPQSKRSKK